MSHGQIIDELEAEISELKEEIDRLSLNHEWTHHRKLDSDQSLPVPRLQITLTEHDPENWEWLYIMVYRHTEGDFVGVPLAKTDSIGGHRFEDLNSVQGILSALPFRVGHHIRRDSAHLNLPAYAIVRGRALLLQKIED